MASPAVESRLRRLERHVGLGGGFGAVQAVTPYERAAAGFEDGSATLADFRLLLGDELHVARAWLVIRAAAFNRAREQGHHPFVHSLLPPDTASRIAAVPLGQEPEAELIRGLVREVAWGPLLRNPRLPMRDLALHGWRSACIAMVALGQPDGLPLRRAIDAGEHENAEKVLLAYGPGPADPRSFAGLCPMNCPACAVESAVRPRVVLSVAR